MNRSLKDSLICGRRSLSSHHHRRGLSLSLNANDSPDDHNHLDLFSKSRRSISLASSDDSSDVSVRLGRLSLGSPAKPTPKPGLDDLLSSTDGGKHDYDWLLTPPGTPLFPTSDGNESQTVPMASRTTLLSRSSSTTKASRLSVSQSSEKDNRSRPARSSSVTRSSICTSQYSTYSNKSSSILNTSSASVSSYIRPSTPSSRSSSTARPSTPSSRPTLSRSSTPSKAHPAPTVASADKVRPSQNSRPSTPTSRPQIPVNLSSPAARSTSRPSTPTRRNPAPSLSAASGSSNLVGRSLQSGRTVSSTSRPSSPNPRVRPTQQPIVIPDFPLETPPNLRTTLPDRPLSAGRSRPGFTVTLKGNVENSGAANLPRRQSSPVVTRGRVPEPLSRGRMLANGQANHTTESHRAPHVSELPTRKPAKTSTESTGFGRTISKKSLDMAIRHMDIRNGTSGNRALSGSTLFPQSIRSSSTKGQLGPTGIKQASGNGDAPIFHNGDGTEHGNYHAGRYLENGNEEDKSQYPAKLTVVDMYESSRYDTLLLKEDLKNTNWLHSLDDKSEQGAIFDSGFEPLPEPFDPL
ncbi:unnamed protein product [Coffea canephora]|uniref:Uncharacterized protein n=1 Tax=Coffea canephora TaxID=49390 RepID=A0A068UDU0_COFCA|nr:unnamed protein product [Coffea canephora]